MNKRFSLPATHAHLFRGGLALGALVLLSAGCQHQTTAPPKLAAPPPLSAEERAEIARKNAQSLELATDPCAVRLQDLGGALAIFYHEYQGFPEHLEDVGPIAKRWGIGVAYTDPTTGEPFVYLPSGLAVPGTLRRLIIYQATPDAKGQRWGLVMSPPPQGMVIVTPEVVHLSPDVFNAYMKFAPRPAPPPPPAPTDTQP